MFIDIKEIGAEGKSISGEFTFEPLEWKDEEIVVSNIAYQILLRWRKSRIHLDGSMDISLTLRCSRCLEMYPLFLQVPLSLTLIDECREINDGNHPLDEEKVDYFFLKEGKADLKEIAAELIYLNIPAKPLCETECKGLCSWCGGNLNAGTCECKDKVQQ